MIALVTYDLHNPGRDYEAVASLLESADSYVHPQGSVWLIDTSASCSTWRDALSDVGDDNDEYLIVRLTRNWASRRLDPSAVRWLKSSDRNW